MRKLQKKNVVRKWRPKMDSEKVNREERERGVIKQSKKTV